MDRPVSHIRILKRNDMNESSYEQEICIWGSCMYDAEFIHRSLFLRHN